MNKFIKTGIVLTIILLLIVMISPDLQAQCPMCRMSAESNLKNGGTDGQGLNTGILYMFFMPYLLVATIGFWWWKNRKKASSSIDELTAPLDDAVSRYN
jgi:hypothetical protein